MTYTVPGCTHEPACTEKFLCELRGPRDARYFHIWGTTPHLFPRREYGVVDSHTIMLMPGSHCGDASMRSDGTVECWTPTLGPRPEDLLDTSAGWFGEDVRPEEWSTGFTVDQLSTVGLYFAAERLAHKPPTETATMKDSRPAELIDTSTTAGKIAVMQAYERGERIEMNDRDHRGSWDEMRKLDGEPDWRWSVLDYRIAPPPAPRTALQAARKHRSAWKGAHNPDSLHLEPLLREIDSSPVLHIHGSGSHANIDWTKTDSGPLTPGRYRLVRDDA